MWAVIETGGKQYRVKEGDVIAVEKIEVPEGEKVTFDRVLMIGKDDSKVEFGTPYLDKARVEAKVLKQGKGRKIIVFKYKKRKNYRRKKGHRQLLTLVQIEKINA